MGVVVVFSVRACAVFFSAVQREPHRVVTPVPRALPDDIVFVRSWRKARVDAC